MNILHAWQRDFLLSIVRLVAGAYPVWHQAPPSPTQKIYFSNHTSHIDTLAILAALPRDVRAVVRPVAARDYWDSSDLKRHIAQKLLNVVLIDRHRETGGDPRGGHPLDPVRDALAQGHSIIIFPEGTRSAEALPQPFKSGLFHLASEFPNVALAPVYLENLQRIMPKGAIWPVPLICKVHFGANEARGDQEDKASFLARMRDALIALAPHRPAG
ncbi:acyltransferase [Burkholderia ubonensis]|uniref:lysophospholipid acyltransferase family protein n=1 Tax=Burkholderia ubonensis TaxID=101571 RepID=UPI00075B3505|nr:lysophospholipid acyltransferase family protein [Burkholderia ubonensis]KWC33095.1 acyltransferase [Burkholderia ubonensis]KWC35324.1 acyltransferase [Burkholderia ubonensis]